MAALSDVAKVGFVVVNQNREEEIFGNVTVVLFNLLDVEVVIDEYFELIE